MVKKLITLIIPLIVMTSCSSDDSSNNSIVYFHPPSWIHGTWARENSSGNLEDKYIFHDDNFCEILTITRCYNEHLEQFDGEAMETKNSDTEYDFYWSITSIVNTYEITKVTDTEITVKLGQTVTTLYKQ